VYHYWSTDTSRGKAFHDVVETYNTANAGKVKVVVDINSDFPAYQEKVKAMISVNETPDLFQYNFNPNDLSRQQSGRLLDFGPFMDSAWKARFNQSDLDMLTVDGKLNSIPFEKGGALIYYNKNKFADAGYSTFPSTWEELFKAFDALKAKGSQAISMYTADDAWHMTNLLTYLAASTGGVPMFAAGENLDSPEMATAVEWLQKAYSYAPADAIGANYSVSVGHINNRSTAMVIDGPWLIGMLESDVVPEISIAPAPVFAGSNVVSPGFAVTDSQSPWAAATQSDPAKEQAIIDFLKYLTSEEVTKRLTVEGQVFLSAKSSFSDAELASISGLLSEYIKVFTAAGESLVNLQRNLTPAANSKLPSLLESLLLNANTPAQFSAQLAAENK